MIMSVIKSSKEWLELIKDKELTEDTIEEIQNESYKGGLYDAYTNCANNMCYDSEIKEVIICCRDASLGLT